MKVLNEGYVDLIESWGGDQTIVEAARMSTNKGFQGWGCAEKPGDEKLLAFLWKNRHTTPFEQAGATFEVQAPLFVFREWHRHRTLSYNELSARYTQMPNIHWHPTVDRIKQSAGSNKQAQGVTALIENDEVINNWITLGVNLQKEIYTHYELGLKIGIPKEIARFNTPVSRYSRMRASGNLLNWLRFLGLRQAKNAQLEIREYANQIADFLKVEFPKTMELFEQQAI